MKSKPRNPYTDLLERAKKLARAVKYARRRVMFVYPTARLHEGWSLVAVAERVKAADQLGYDVHLVVADDGLRAVYVQRVEVPFDWA